MAINSATTVGFPNNTGGIMRLADVTDVVDNVFVFLDDAGVKWERIPDGPYSVRWAKIFGNGTNYLAALNTILAHSRVSQVLIDLDGGGSVTLNGTLNCGGKTITFMPNNSLTTSTSLTIDNAVIDADFQTMIFASTNVTLTNCASTKDKFSVCWYGAKSTAEGKTNSKPEIQKAADMVISNNGMPRILYFPKRVGTNTIYQCTSEIILNNWSGAAYSYFSINLMGDVTSRFSDNGNSVQINFTGTTTFGFGFQRGLSCNVEGLWINGPFSPGFSDFNDFASRLYTAYASAGGVRDNPTSPFSGIVIDPFSNSLGSAPSAGNRYPGLDAFYRGDGSISGSSAINIKNCRIMGFTVDVMYSPNGATLNCESMVLENCALDVCKAAVAYGQSQTKGNVIRDCIHIDRVHTVIDCYTYGQQIGGPPHVYGGTIAGFVNRLCNINAVGYYGAYFKDIFCESLFRIGTCVTGMASNFIGCKFDFASATVSDQVPDKYFIGDNTAFVGCTIRSYNALYYQRQSFHCDNIQFDNCTFSRPPILQFRNDNGGIQIGHYKNCRTTFDNGIIGAPDGVIANHGGVVRNYYLTGRFKLRNYNLVSFGHIDYAYNQSHLDNYVGFSIATGTIASNRTASITIPVGGRAYVQVHDYLVDISGTMNYYDAVTPTGPDQFAVLGRISAINNSTGVATLVEIPINVVAGTYASTIALHTRKAQVPFTGDITGGSAQITNVRVQGGQYPSQGDRIELYGTGQGGYGVGMFITAVNAGAKTVDVSEVFNNARTKVDFIMGDPEMTIYNRFDLGPGGANPWVHKGTKWKRLSSADGTFANLDPARWEFLSSGYVDASFAGETVAYQAAYTRLAKSRRSNKINVASDNATDNTAFIVEAGTMVTEIVVKPASDLTAFKAGTSASGNDVIFDQTVISADGFTTISVNQYFDTQATLYFSGIGSVSTDLIIYKK